jgi:hypothetical protein
MKKSQKVLETLEKWINRVCNESNEIQEKYLKDLLLEKEYFKNLFQNYSEWQIKKKNYIQ